MAQTTANLVGSVLSRNDDIQVDDPEDPSQNPDLNHDIMIDHELPLDSSPKSWTVKAKRMHRVVEQVDQEPIGIVMFKWCLIFIGSAMLGKSFSSLKLLFFKLRIFLQELSYF